MNPSNPALKPKVLVAPLDWGLGHATRCIPLIGALGELGCEVILAGEGATEKLLRTEFPHLPFLSLPGYRVHYTATAWQLPFSLAAQIPKIYRAIQEEHRWLKNVVATHGIHAVIADNRYGLYHREIPSILITHQLCIQSPFSIGNQILKKLHYRLIKNFDACWVPDSGPTSEVGGNLRGLGLAGLLSHPKTLPPVPVSYLGPLSRLKKTDAEASRGVLVLLSGPEPQRTLLEQRMTEGINRVDRPVTLVRGLPLGGAPISLPDHVEVFDHLPTEALNEKINEAALVVARSGYSTVMDLAVLGKKSVLIPTPGQTEQAYLARHLEAIRFAPNLDQQHFHWEKLLRKARNFSYQLFPAEPQWQDVLSRFVEEIGKMKSQPLPSQP